MNYKLNKDPADIKNRICQINGIDETALDVSDFRPDYDLEVIQRFKETLLSAKDKRFFIVGDYDCDGICATVIIRRLLNDLGIEANYYIPSRSKQGYGVNMEIVRTAYDHGFEAIFCVDNGVVAYEPLAYARSLGLKTFIIDHHEYSEINETDAFLHPSLFPEKYHDMCAAGLCALLSNSFRNDDLSTVYGGLATLADMVEVLNYNRYLLKEMLKILNEKMIYPVSYLLSGNPLTYESLSYNVIPKINAVSRLEEMMNVNHVVRFLSDDSSGCMKYLSKIEEINKTRKDLTAEMSNLALRLCNENDPFIVIRSEVFKEGLCGLIANRLLNTYNRPILVLSEKDGELKGSGRAPAGFDMFGYLNETKELFTAYGGHAQAVGLSLSTERFEELAAYINSHPIDHEEEEKEVLYFELDDLDESIIEKIDELQPYGPGFKEPLLCIDGDYQKKYIIKGLYPKFVMNERMDAISFNSRFIDKDFKLMIGRLKHDNYHKNKLSFVIEDLI